MHLRAGKKAGPVQTEMARRKFRSNQRHEPTTERSFQEYLLSTPAPQTSRTELMRLVRGGEDTFLELKVKLSNPEKVAHEIIALANTGGGLMVFGVNDNMRVEGLDDAEEVREELVRICRETIVPSLFPYIDCISFDSGRRVVTLDVEGKQKPYCTRDGRYYIRIGAEKREASIEELNLLIDDVRPAKYENMPAINSKIADIDEALLWSYLRWFEGDAFEEASTNGYPTADILERDLLLTAKYREESVPSIVGLLLFGHNERVATLIPRSSVIATRFAGDNPQSDIVERIQISGNLYTIFESTMRFITRYSDLWEARPRNLHTSIEDDSPVLSRSNYHRDVVSEAVANALVHRDLTIRELTTRINIYERSIEIVNPRRSNGFAQVAQKAIKFGLPHRLNPQLAAIFYSSAYGVQLPSRAGLPMLLHQSRIFSGRKSEIHTSNDEFRLRLYGI
jgi:ATP-dependent DNA helicase RecG